jgi:hypothetical protein
MLLGLKPIKIIGWWFILWPCFSIIHIALILNDPLGKEVYEQVWESQRILYFIMYIGYFVNLISGIAILKRKNWGRYSFLIWGIFYFCVGIFTEPSTTDVIRQLAFYLSFCYFLFRPKANEYFDEKVINLYRE